MNEMIDMIPGRQTPDNLPVRFDWQGDDFIVTMPDGAERHFTTFQQARTRQPKQEPNMQTQTPTPVNTNSDPYHLAAAPNSTRHYSTEPFTTAQVDAARRILHRDGWEYKEDRFYPTTDPRRKGWWVNTCNPEITQHSRPRGDSKDFWYATQCTYRLYSGHSDEELS